MARIQEPLARAGWRCSTVIPSQRFPFQRTVKLQKTMACGHLLHANLSVDLERGRVEKVELWHWRPPPDQRPAAPAEVLDGLGGLADALRHGPGGYPLTREEHARQRAKTIGRMRGWPAQQRPDPMPGPIDGFPVGRAAPAAANADGAAGDHEPEP